MGGEAIGGEAAGAGVEWIGRCRSLKPASSKGSGSLKTSVSGASSPEQRHMFTEEWMIIHGLKNQDNHMLLSQKFAYGAKSQFNQQLARDYCNSGQCILNI